MSAWGISDHIQLIIIIMIILYLLADLHGLLIVRFKELKVLIDLNGFSSILAHVKHWLN